MNIKYKYNLLGTDEIQNKSNFEGWPAVNELSKLLKRDQNLYISTARKQNKNRKQTKYTQETYCYHTKFQPYI